MKVLDLQCTQGHAFEGWFSSEDDFQSQLARQLVECPLCGDRAVAKLPSAPRLNLSGAGSAPPLTLGLCKSRGGMELRPAPNKGAAPAITDLLGKVTHAGVFAAANVIPYVKDGRLKALAVTGSKRLKALPNVPSMAEAGFQNFSAAIWIGFLAPASTPDPVVRDMQQQFARALTSPEVQKRMEANEFDVVANSPEEFAKFLKREAEIWGSVAKRASLVAE